MGALPGKIEAFEVPATLTRPAPFPAHLERELELIFHTSNKRDGDDGNGFPPIPEDEDAGPLLRSIMNPASAFVQYPNRLFSNTLHLASGFRSTT
jgi:hypothetical protein